MPKFYKKKILKFEAVYYDGNNQQELENFLGMSLKGWGPFHLVNSYKEDTKVIITIGQYVIKNGKEIVSMDYERFKNRYEEVE